MNSKKPYNYRKKYNSHLILKKFKTIADYLEYRKMYKLKQKLPKNVNYLHFNKKLKQGIFLKKPSSKDIKYPFYLNLKLINEYIKKK